ncbi:hypothetical protein SAMN05216357_10337 [Porphyromonadaceae bacterium KH3CP3RA]|nr:hypothetical protein SAMN05216357_10337 [Porphyromonadaceae bacterium KH3CP3RA]
MIFWIEIYFNNVVKMKNNLTFAYEFEIGVTKEETL